MKKNIAGSLPPVLLPRIVRSAEHLWVKLSGTNGPHLMLICARFNPPVQDAVLQTVKIRNTLPMRTMEIAPPLLPVAYAER